METPKTLITSKLIFLIATYFFFSAAFTTFYMVITSSLYHGDMGGQNRWDAEFILGTLTIGTFFCGILGGLLGDLVLSRKWTMLIGVVTFFIGVLLLLVSMEKMLTVAVNLVALGTGLIKPNLYSLYGLGFNKNKLDSAYTILLLVALIGGLLGSLIINQMDIQEPTIGLVTTLFFLLLTGLMTAFYHRNREEMEEKEESFVEEVPRLGLIILAIGLLFLYLGGEQFREHFIANRLPASDSVFGLFYFNKVSTLVIAVLFVFLWWRFEMRSIWKVLLGLVLAVSSGAMYYIVDYSSNFSFSFTHLSAILLGVFAHLLIVPSVAAIVNRDGGSRFISTRNSLLFLPKEIYSYIAMAIFFYVWNGGF